MVGERTDLVSRLRAVLPPGWFDSDAPVLDGLLDAVATPWVNIYDLVRYAASQTRVATATHGWLDLIAVDFFGSRIRRRHLESDSSFRTAIQNELLRERATRQGLIRGLQNLTGRTPTVFEPGHTGDTGAYGGAQSESGFDGHAFAYGVAGGWGNLTLPFQAFVTAYRPVREGGENGGGWGEGGYNNGYSSYADSTILQGTVTDTDIYRAVSSALPASTVAWTRIMG